MSDLPDSDLVRAAQGGDAASLGVLLQRHQAGMRAAALGVLGYRPEVEDAVQEACLIVVRRLGDLREPQAVSGWLRTIVRNQARLQWRSRTARPTADLDAVLAPNGDLDPARLLEQHALADWLGHAVNLLSPEQRLVTRLRYFTDVTAYEQIADVCGVPVGTVRSRLAHARSRLAENLLASEDVAHEDQRALTRARHQEAAHTFEAGRQGRYGKAMAEYCLPTVEMTWAHGGRTYGFEHPSQVMARNVGDGVRYQVANVVAGSDVLIWEADLISPAEDPFHCPPGAVLVHSLRGGLTTRIRLFHPPREVRPTPAPSERVAQVTSRTRP